LQETLTNIARHANAKRVISTLECVEEMLILTIRDDGAGFDMEEVKAKKSLGLIGMRERALLFEGELLITSTKGMGTSVTLKVPYLKATTI
jgi:signal transduction histidine kinase